MKKELMDKNITDMMTKPIAAAISNPPGPPTTNPAKANIKNLVLDMKSPPHMEAKVFRERNKGAHLSSSFFLSLFIKLSVNIIIGTVHIIMYMLTISKLAINIIPNTSMVIIPTVMSKRAVSMNTNKLLSFIINTSLVNKLISP